MSTPPVSGRIYGRSLYLTVAGTDYAPDVQECVVSFEPRDTDDLTFGEASGAGADQGKIKIKAIQSTDTASFWRYAWSNPGAEVAFAMAPHGNAVASADKPHLTGTLTVGTRPDLGGAADPKKAYSFEVEWMCVVDDALKVTGP